jgi:hypothetical protein
MRRERRLELELEVALAWELLELLLELVWELLLLELALVWELHYSY